MTAGVWAAVPEPNTMPPAVGRTNVWIMSLMLSSAGILSATISMTSSTATIVITQPFSSQAQPCGKRNQVGEPGQQAQRQQRDVGVEPRRGRQPQAGQQFHIRIMSANQSRTAKLTSRSRSGSPSMSISVILSPMTPKRSTSASRPVRRDHDPDRAVHQRGLGEAGIGREVARIGGDRLRAAESSSRCRPRPTSTRSTTSVSSAASSESKSPTRAACQERVDEPRAGGRDPLPGPGFLPRTRRRARAASWAAVFF